MKEEVSERACREQAAYDSSRVHEHSARLQSRFAHIFSGPNSLAAESFFAGRLTAWAPGADVLDYGCYTGELEEVLLPLSPRSVVGIDISSKAIGDARRKRRPQCEYHVMDASRTTFPDSSFDLVVGRAILHHLDFEPSLREVHRLLRPGGHALFVEPLRGNPVAKVIRTLTPRARTSDEAPLTRTQVRLGDNIFGSGEHFFANLLSVPAGVISSLLARTPDNPAMRAADSADRALARTSLRYWMRLVVLAWELRN